MFSRFQKILFIFLALFFFTGKTFAAEPLMLKFFYGDGCPHCSQEEKLLQKLEEKYPDKLLIKKYEIYHNQENSALFNQFIQQYNIQTAGVPLLIIGDDYVLGYGGENTTGAKIEEKITLLLNIEQKEDKNNSLYLNLFSQKIDLKAISLPLATILIAFVDGFNPCAMWVLIFLITMLINMKDRKKLYILGSIFIFISSLVYLVFLAAWFNFFKFIGYVYWIKIIIGIVAIISGIFHIKEGLFSKGECHVTNASQRKNIINKMKETLNQKSFLLAILGISVLAVSVNLIEVVCSAGLPAIYTNLLSTIKLSPIQYYSYLLLYVLIFMLDDLFIFFVAIKTFEVTGIAKKYTKWSGIIGGFVIFIIGIILILKPELLMFNF